MGAILEDIRTWTESTGSGLRTFTAPDGNRWIEQNPKRSSGWAKLAQQGRQIAWEFGPGRDHGYTGRVMKIFRPVPAGVVMMRLSMR